jgi:hypothetical protein
MPTTSSGETEQVTDWQRPSRFLQKSNFYFANEKIFAPKEENSKGIENKEKLGDRLRVLGPHCYNKKNIRWLSYNDRKMQKKRKKTRQCCKTDKSCFFQLLLLLGGPFFYHVVDFPDFLKKSKSDFPFRPFFFSQYVSVVKRFFTTPKNLKKAVHPKRESSTTPTCKFPFHFY